MPLWIQPQALSPSSSHSRASQPPPQCPPQLPASPHSHPQLPSILNAGFCSIHLGHPLAFRGPVLLHAFAGHHPLLMSTDLPGHGQGFHGPKLVLPHSQLAAQLPWVPSFSVNRSPTTSLPPMTSSPSQCHTEPGAQCKVSNQHKPSGHCCCHRELTHISIMSVNHSSSHTHG